MSWDDLTRVLKAELGEDANALCDAIRYQLPGVRITVPCRPAPSEAEIRRVLREHRWNVDSAARALGVHRSTIYRKLQPSR